MYVDLRKYGHPILVNDTQVALGFGKFKPLEFHYEIAILTPIGVYPIVFENKGVADEFVGQFTGHLNNF